MKKVYLAHHGINGQHWGVRNGPPYPLNKATHNRVTKGASNYGSNKSVDKSSTPNHTKLSRYVIEQATGVNPEMHMDNCKEVALTIAQNISDGKHRIAPAKSHKGNLYDMISKDFGIPDSQMKTLYEERFVSPDNAQRRCTDAILSKWGEGAVGMIGIKSGKSKEELEKLQKTLNLKDPVDGHAFNWIIENGEVKFFDGQSNTCKEASKMLQGVEPGSIAEMICYSDPQPLKSHMQMINQQQMVDEQNRLFQEQATRDAINTNNQALDASNQATRDAINASNQAASLSISGGTNPFMFGMM